MNFFKKNIIYVLLMVIITILFVVPGLKEQIKSLLFPIAKVESAIKIEEKDYDIALKGINVEDTNLKNFYGKKIVFLNFWGTWCPPCRMEWPSIQSLYNGKKGKVDFVLIAMQDKEEEVRKFLQENHYTVPVYIAQSPLNEKLLPKVFPTTFLLSKEGQILLKEDSSKDWDAKSVHEFIDNITR